MTTNTLLSVFESSTLCFVCVLALLSLALGDEEAGHGEGGDVGGHHGGRGNLHVVLGEPDDHGGEGKTSDNEDVGGGGEDAVLGLAPLVVLVGHEGAAGEDEGHTEGVPLSGELLGEVVAVKVALGVLLSGGAGEAEEGHLEGLEASLDAEDTNALSLGEGEDGGASNRARHVG